jgi:nucleotide-binding universal stress UspA family protein
MDDGVLRHAAAMASTLGVPLTLLHVVETGGNTTPLDPLDWDVRHREAKGYLSQVVARLRDSANLDLLDVQLRQGSAPDQIRRWTLAHHRDLTVFGRHGEHGPSDWALSSTARKLVEGTSGSLLVVPPESSGRAAAGPAAVIPRYRRILVPLDGSLMAESALASAVTLARVHHAALLVAHVVPGANLTQIGPSSERDLKIEHDVLARNETVARVYLQRVRANLHDSGLRARLVIRQGGDPREQLEHVVARDLVDLVVLSSHGRTCPRNTACGSIAAHLLTHVAVPMLVFREGRKPISPTPALEARRPDAARPPLRAG